MLLITQYQIKSLGVLGDKGKKKLQGGKMSSLINKARLVALFVVIGGFGQKMVYADIVFTGGSADINWYYESATQTWHTVLRNKGTTIATGLDNAFPAFTGIVGHGDDYEFNTLTVSLITPHIMTHNGVDFFLSRAGGSSPSPLTLATPETTDLGIRKRLRENEVALGIGSEAAANQFANFELVLNLANSSFNGTPLTTPGSPYVGLFHWDAFDDPVDMINTHQSVYTATFDNYDHVHRNWGFSEVGEYVLAFEFNGVGGTYGATAPTGSTSINFDVIPEPSSMALVLIGLGFGGWLRSRRLHKG